MSRLRHASRAALLLAGSLALQPVWVSAKDGADSGGRESSFSERSDHGHGRTEADKPSREVERDRAAQDSKTDVRSKSDRDAQRQEAKRGEDAAKLQADAQKEAAKRTEDAAKEQAKSAEDVAKDAPEERKESAASGEGAWRYLDRFRIERDALGLERVRDEVLVLGDAESAGRLRDADYPVLSEQALAESPELLLRVAVARSRSLEQTLAELHALLPQAWIAANHIYRPSTGTPAIAAAVPGAVPGAAPASPLPSVDKGVTIGLLDTGADAGSPLLSNALRLSRSFTRSAYTPRAHGTLVAELAAARGAGLAVADVFGADEEDLLVAPADAMAAALSWLIAQRVAVINISIEGPDNPIMAMMIRRAIAAGVVVVAAAGNRGPAAAPAFPAAYPDVIAVTAVDPQGRVYRRANQGPYISFAAPGVNIVCAGHCYEGRPVSGTSFAAPQIAALAAEQLRNAAADDASSASARVMRLLRLQARDLGVAGFDPVYGWGLPEMAGTGTTATR